jgi:hypothetical protein
MTRQEFLTTIQSRAARGAVSPSAVRGRGHRGTVAAARSFLRQVDLTQFGCSNARDFAKALNRTTGRLQRVLPLRGRRWGIARKVLNIFLRDCLYTTHLESAYHLARAECFLELPLDSITGTQLKRAAGRGRLPQWPGVRHLKSSVSAKFQRAADAEATRQGIARVHLDAVWFSVARDEDAG